VGPVKTEESEKVMPLDDETLATLQSWREETPYATDRDFIFASSRMHGRQPLWPEALMRNHIAPAARRAGITKHLSWHVFRHTFSTMLAANGEDVEDGARVIAARESVDHHGHLHARGEREEAGSA